MRAPPGPIRAGSVPRYGSKSTRTRRTTYRRSEGRSLAYPHGMGRSSSGRSAPLPLSRESPRFLCELGRGGMGVVSLAVTLGPAGFHKLKVVKKLHDELSSDASVVAMFLDEARVSAALHHPNIVQINEVGFDGRSPWLEMEYLEGLGWDVVRNQALPSLEMCVWVMGQVLEGLQYAHEACAADGRSLGLVHRDVSPHNVVVTYDGAVKLVDFGIAKAIDRLIDTAAGVVKGKPTYMAPEQAAGSAVDRRADIFAVGVMLWEAMTCRCLWAGLEEPVLLSRLRRGDFPRPSAVADVPPDLEATCLRAMAPDPNERYSTAAEMQLDIDAWLEKTPSRIGHRALANHLQTTFAERRAARRREIEQRLLRLDSSLASPSPTQRPTMSTTLPAPSDPTSTRTVHEGAIEQAVARVLEAGTSAGLAHLAVARAQRLRGDNAALAAAGAAAAQNLPEGSAPWFEAVADAALGHGRLGDLAGLERWAWRASEVGDDGSAEGAEARALSLCRIAIDLFYAGASDLALRLAAQLDALLPPLPPHVVGARAHARAVPALIAGRLEEALRLFSESAEAFAHAGALERRSIELNNVAFVMLELGLFGPAAPTLEEALRLGRTLGVGPVEAGARATMALCQLRLGRPREAIELACEAVAYAETQGIARFVGAAHLYEGLARLALGETTGAETAVSAAISDFAATPAYRAFALGVRARIRLQGPEPASAGADARAAMALLRQLGGLEAGECLVRLSHIEVLETEGRAADARRAASIAQNQIRLRAAAILDPFIRAQFMAIPEHTAVLAKAAC
ncbi:MAG: serine/threonine protein kinase [Myxococcales bacterium]|nr:serine/threonine protein kinase [Myxococcales bacterium]